MAEAMHDQEGSEESEEGTATAFRAVPLTLENKTLSRRDTQPRRGQTFDTSRRSRIASCSSRDASAMAATR